MSRACISGIVLLAVIAGCGGSTAGSGTGGSGAIGSGAAGGSGATGGTAGTSPTGGGGSSGSGASGASGGTAGTGATGGGGFGGGTPPAGTSLAVRRVFLGDTDTNSIPDPTAWRKFGMNLDGLVSTKTDTAHCKVQAGGVKSFIQTDGDNGIDNSWGSNLMPIMKSLAADPSKNVNDGIAAGGPTLMLSIAGLTTAPDQSGLSVASYAAAQFSGGIPKWDGSDVRLTRFESVSGGNINQPLTSFPASLVAGGVLSAGPPTTMQFPLQGDLILFGDLRIHLARVSATITGVGGSAKATAGIVAGVIDTEEMVVELKKVAGSFDPTLCSGATFDSIAQQIRAASDIMKDGTNGDPTKTCNGISIGLGFEAVAVTLAGVAPQQPPTPDPCN